MSRGYLIAAALAANSAGWRQVGEFGLGWLLSSVIGAERELRQKSAGLRTHTLVGVGAALFMLISKYGFGNVLHPGLVVVDPSRVAAQIVTGVGFLGAGLIFVRRDSVLGLTTAASVWVTAAVGAAAGAGLVVLAITATGAYLIVTLAFPQVIRRLSGKRPGMSLRVSYPDGRGILRQVLQAVTELGFTVDHLATKRNGPSALAPGPAGDQGTGDQGTGDQGTVEVALRVSGKDSVGDLAARLSEVPGVTAVTSNDPNADSP